MQKIPTMFVRDWDGDRSRVLDQIVPGCEWVAEGEGNALRKYDGTCVMFDGEQWFARREVKEGKEPPPNFRPVEHDHKTLRAIGWQPVSDSPFAKFFYEAIDRPGAPMEPGTYELIGPKIQGNPEKKAEHWLIKHDLCEGIGNLDRSYNGIKRFLSETDWEGIVFHHPDGRMAKIKKRDFGLHRSKP